MRPLLLLTLLAATLLIATSAGAADKSESARLERGEIIVRQTPVKGSDMPAATVKAIIEAPPEKIWAVIDKCARYKKVMPRTAESKELSRKGPVVHCRITVELPFPFSNLTSTTKAVHTTRKGYWQRAWTLVEGDYKINSGSWTLTSHGDTGKRTMVVYRMHAEPNVSLPVWLQKRAARSTLPGLIKAVDKAVGARRPAD